MTTPQSEGKLHHNWYNGFTSFPINTFTKQYVLLEEKNSKIMNFLDIELSVSTFAPTTSFRYCDSLFTAFVKMYFDNSTKFINVFFLRQKQLYYIQHYVDGYRVVHAQSI